jgi:hypothetical protein
MTILTECKDCNSLKDQLNKLKCTLLLKTKKKYHALIYNLAYKKQDDKIKDVIRWQKLIEKRIYNCSYPDSAFTNQDILLKLNNISVKDDCSQCPTCFPELTP